MKTGEITRIIVFILIGALLVFWVQPQLYSLRIFVIPNPTGWLEQIYKPSALLVFITATLATLIWTAMTATAKVQGGQNILNWQLTWWLIGLLPLLGICLAIYLFAGAGLYSRTGLFVLDALFLYWLPTTTSSPGLLKKTPPGASFFREFF